LSSVSIVKCENYDRERVLEAVRKAFDLIGGIKKYIKPGMNVALKPNLLTRKSPDSAATVHPEVVYAVGVLVKEAGGHPKIVESPGGPYSAAMLKAVYSPMCYPDGGTVDDLLVYTLGEEDYMLVVNAANKDKDVGHIKESLASYKKLYADRTADVEIIDESDLYGQIAVQGPGSLDCILEVAGELGLTGAEAEELAALKRFRSMTVPVAGEALKMIVSRTGHTRGNGYEFYIPAGKTARYWDVFIKAGVVPCGLGSRDTLRLEAGMPLYGHEMSPEISALDGGMAFFVDLEHDFQGKVMEDKVTRKQIALVSDTKAIPREGYEVYVNGEKAGVVSSGTFSPVLEKGIAFAFVAPETPETGTVEVLVRKNLQPFTVVKPPFVKGK